jgi:hypothetical protein
MVFQDCRFDFLGLRDFGVLVSIGLYGGAQ